MASLNKRLKYLNLIKIRLPITGVVSFAHRVSGLLMFLAIPFLIYLLQLSSASPDGYQLTLEYLSHPLVKLVTLVLLWSVSHHLLAGIRFLLIDVDIGVEKPVARMSAGTVLFLSITLSLLFVVLVLL